MVQKNERPVDEAGEDNRDTTNLPGAGGTVSGQGRGGGRLAREVGTRDEAKRATERPAGSTRVRKEDEKAEGS